MNEELIIGALGVSYIISKINKNIKHRVSLTQHTTNQYSLLITPGIDGVDIDNVYDYVDLFKNLSNIITFPHSTTLYHKYQSVYASSHIDLQIVSNFKTDNIEMLAYNLIYGGMEYMNYRSVIDVAVYDLSKENVNWLLSETQQLEKEWSETVILSDTGYVELLHNGENNVIVEYNGEDDIDIYY